VPGHRFAALAGDWAWYICKLDEMSMVQKPIAVKSGFLHWSGRNGRQTGNLVKKTHGPGTVV